MKTSFDPDARCHWRAKDPFFQGETCRHSFKKHRSADQHIDENTGVGFACTGGHDDDEDTWCCCPGFEPSPDSRRFPDVYEQRAYEKAMRGE